MLLEKIVEIVAPLVVEIEVLALSFTFGAHHFGDGCPVPAVLNQPWGGGGLFTVSSRTVKKEQLAPAKQY